MSFNDIVSPDVLEYKIFAFLCGCQLRELSLVQKNWHDIITSMKDNMLPCLVNVECMCLINCRGINIKHCRYRQSLYYKCLECNNNMSKKCSGDICIKCYSQKDYAKCDLCEMFKKDDVPLSSNDTFGFGCCKCFPESICGNITCSNCKFSCPCIRKYNFEEMMENGMRGYVMPKEGEGGKPEGGKSPLTPK